MKSLQDSVTEMFAREAMKIEFTADVETNFVIDGLRHIWNCVSFDKFVSAFTRDAMCDILIHEFKWADQVYRNAEQATKGKLFNDDMRDCLFIIDVTNLLVKVLSSVYPECAKSRNCDPVDVYPITKDFTACALIWNVFTDIEKHVQ